MTMVDWPSTLRRASWRGVPFFVESDDLEVGRRLVVHEFPNRDRPFVEDLGEKAIKYSINAYLASDNLLGQSRALIGACRTRGPGTLVLPVEGSQLVRCNSCRRSHERDRMGYIAYQLEFVEAGVGLSATPYLLTGRLVGSLVNGAITSLTNGFLQGFNTLRADMWVVASAIAEVQTWAETFDAVRSTMRMETQAGIDLRTGADLFYRDAADLAVDGRDTTIVEQDQISPAYLESPAGKVVGRVHDLCAFMVAGAADTVEAFEGMQELAEYQIDAVDPTAYGLSGLQDQSNLDTFRATVRRVALLNMANAAVLAEWETREQMVAARAVVAELFERELHGATDGSDVFQNLMNVRNKAAQALSERLHEVDPVVTVESNTVVPSIVWAYRLYGDAARAGDLIRRNRIAHPSFMPPQFEAESPAINDDHISDNRRNYGVSDTTS